MTRRRATSVQQLVDAAANVFERKGFVEATISDIAAEAGVSRPTVYQYVTSKRWLLEAIIEQVLYPLRHGIGEIVVSDLPAREKLIQYLRVQVKSAIRYRTYYLVFTANRQQLSPQTLLSYTSWARDVNEVASDLVALCIEEGSVRADLDVTTTVHLINGMILSIPRWHRTDGRVDSEELLTQMVRLLSGCILPLTTD